MTTNHQKRSTKEILGEILETLRAMKQQEFDYWEAWKLAKNKEIKIDIPTQIKIQPQCTCGKNCTTVCPIHHYSNRGTTFTL